MLNESNDYIGTIAAADLQEIDGKLSAFVVCKPDGSAETARWFGSFSDTVISKGRNEGKMVGEMTAETLGQFGCTDFSKIGQIVGQRVAFGVRHKQSEKDPTKTFVECSFIRPPRAANPASAAGVASLSKFRAAAMAAAKNAPKPAAAPPKEREPGDDSYDDHVGEDPFA
jgi:hypothetical protein